MPNDHANTLGNVWALELITKLEQGDEKYSSAMVDAALEILPHVIDGLYLQAEKEDETAKMLAKARSVNPDASNA